MKVYDLKTLLITIFGGGALIAAFALKLFSSGDLWGIFWILFSLKLVWDGLRASLTKSGYEENQQRAVHRKCVYRKLFGRLTPVMPYSVVIVYLAAVGLVALIFRVYSIRPPLWIFLLILLVPVGYAAWFGWIVSKHMDMEETKQLLHENDPSVMTEDIRSESHDI